MWLGILSLSFGLESLKSVFLLPTRDSVRRGSMQTLILVGVGSNPAPPSMWGDSIEAVRRVYCVIVKAEVREEGLSE